jgi:osmotically-inducible protein OsmY
MVNDKELQRAVLAALVWMPSVAAAHIGVVAREGVVTLTGHVESFAQKHAAETAARLLKGVKAVAEEIEVRLPFDALREDDDIAGAALERLAWDVSVPREAVKVMVEKGHVSLTGQVEWQYQRAAAEQDVRRLHGVVGVSNQILLKPRGNDQDIGKEITHAMHRTWFFDPDSILVSAAFGCVRLTGSVSSPHERRLAAITAWSAPGVTDVVNDISIA